MTNVFKNQILACLFLLLSDIALAANVMQISTATVQANQQIVLNVLINNSDPFVAFQLDLDLPAPFAYIANSAVLSSARTNGHSINATILDGNVLRILGFSLNNSAFKGTSGTIASFTLRAGSVPGNYSLTPVNAIIGQVNSVNVLTSVTSGIITLQSPDIALNTTSLDFGRIPLGSSGDQYVTLSNPGNQNLILSNIAFNSPYFSVVGSSAFTILPNGSSVVKVHFVSSAKGTYPNAMTITTNDPDQPVTTVSLQAFAFAVNELRCGNMAAYSGSQATVSLSVNNMEPFTGFQFDLQLPSSLTYVQGSAQLSARKTNHLVSANVLASNVLRIVSYSADNHAFSGTSGDVVILKFAVAGTGGTYPLNLSNVIIGDASGTNIISASYNGSEVIAAADINSNSSMSFGDVSMLATSSQVLRLYNYGDDTLKVSQLQFSEPSFFAEEVAPFRVDKGAFKDITVKMHPSTLGSKTGNLRIFSNDPDENPKIISLTGNGYNANYISVRDTALCNASKISFQVSAENYEPFVGFQFDISFPSTMTYFDGSAKLSPRAQDHSVSVSLINATTLRVLAFSLQQKPFLGGTGAIVSLDFTLNVATQNTLPITLSNAIMGNSLSQNILYGTQNGTVTLYSKPSLVAASASPNPICTGTTLTLTGSATNATNWSWTGPNSFTSTLQNPTISSITTAGAGVYTLTAGNSCGSATAVNTSSVTVNSKPTGVTALGSPNPICASTTLTLTGSATNATSWSWTGPNSFTSTLQNPTISSITTAGAGVYTLTASNSCGSATAVNTSSITVNSKPTGVAASASPNPICASTTLTLTGSATNATNWNWTGPNSFSSTLQNPTISSITTAGAGVYTLTVGNSCGSATAVNTESIIVSCVGLIDGKDVTTKIYPNPTDGLFTFIYQNASGERLTNLDLYNNVGSHIKSLLKGENKSEINEVFNIQSLPNGTYYLVIRTQVRLYTLMLSVYKK